MSASLISAARARLPEYHDGTHLAQELIGSHSLSVIRFADVASDPSRETIRSTIRRLLVRLKIIFDYQMSFFVLRDFEEFTLASAGLNLPDRDFCLEATLFLLYRATDIEHPSTLGQNEYSLYRGLTFAALLSVFRALCLHRTSFTEEEDNVIRQRVGHACQRWDAQQPLSKVEELVLCQLIPQTLDNIRVKNGDCTLQTFCCGKCDEPSYLQGHAAVCIDPSSAQYRSDSLRCCQSLIELILGKSSEIDHVEAFWTLHDINWSLMVVTIQGTILDTTSDPSFREVATATTEMWERVRKLDQGSDKASHNGTLCTFFADIARYLGGDTDFLFPASSAESGYSKQKVNEDIADFERDLAIRSRVRPRRKYTKPQLSHSPRIYHHGTEETTTELRADSEAITTPVDDVRGTNEETDTGLKLKTTTQPVKDEFTDNFPDMRAGEESPVDPDQEDGLIYVAVDLASVDIPSHVKQSPISNEKPSHLRPPEKTTERPFSYELQNGSQQSRSDVLHVVARKDDLQPRYSTSPEQSSPRKPYTSQAAIVLPTSSETQQSSPNASRSNLNRNSQNSNSWQSGGSEQSTLSSPFRQQAISSLSPAQTILRSSPLQSVGAPTPLNPNIIIDSGLQVVEEHDLLTPPQLTGSPQSVESPQFDYLRYTRHQSPTPTYAPSELSSIPAPPYALSEMISSKTSTTKKSGFFRLRKSSSSSMIDKPSSSQVPDDLCFCFSMVGTSLLLWGKRNTDHIIKLVWPFQSGFKLPLRPAFPHAGFSWSANFNVRLVGAGNQLVVVVVNQDKHYKLYYFDQYARRFEVQLENPNVLPTALAVSRDDSKIAICCGAMVFIYEVTIHAYRLMGSVPAHSRASNLPANRRLQQANFSLDSIMLVTATQEYHGTEKSPYQVHVCLWRCLPLTIPVLEVELDPVVLDLGYGNDPGLWGVFCSIDHTNPANSRVFLAAQTAKIYDCILMPAKNHKNKRLVLKEKSIGAAAQAPSSQSSTNDPASIFFGNHYVFKNGRHDLGMMDIRTGIHQHLASFASERSGLKLDQEAMAVAFPNETLVLAFWRSWKGDLVLKQVDLNLVSGKPGAIHTMELKDVFHRVNMQQG